MKTLSFFIIAILFLGANFAARAFGQDDRILVDGKPPLTRENADAIIEYYERGLSIEFTDEQREEAQTRLINQWRRAQKANAQNLVKFLQVVTKINALDETKRENFKDELRRAILGDLQNTPSNEVSQFILNVYESANGDRSDPAAQIDDETTNERIEASKTNDETPNKPNEEILSNEAEYKPVSGAVRLSDLAGAWSKTSVSTSGYRNAVTDDYRSAYGFSNLHDIKPTGDFDYSNFATISTYGCTTELFTRMKGRISIKGSEVIFSYLSGTVNIKDSCKKSDVARPAQIEPATFRLERGADGLRMCEVGKANPYCLYKMKE